MACHCGDIFIIILFTAIINVNAGRIKFVETSGLPLSEVSGLTLQTFSSDEDSVVCGRQCVRLTACKAFLKHNGNCTLLSDPSAVITPGSGIEFFMKLRPVAGCFRRIGGFGGPSFDLSSAYSPNDDYEISRVRVFYSSNRRQMIGIELTYGGVTVVSAGDVSGVEEGDCRLVAGETIDQIRNSIDLRHGNKPVVASVTFITALQTCGPYGIGTQTEVTYGHQLLYIKGGAGAVVDRINLAFETCVA